MKTWAGYCNAVYNLRVTAMNGKNVVNIVRIIQLLSFHQ